MIGLDEIKAAFPPPDRDFDDRDAWYLFEGINPDDLIQIGVQWGLLSVESLDEGTPLSDDVLVAKIATAFVQGFEIAWRLRSEREALA